MMTLAQVTGKIRELKPLPPTATKLTRILSSPLFSIEDCVDSIRYDEALTIDILKYANSAFAGATREVTGIREAVIRLGGTRILKEILAKHLKKSLNEELPAYGYSELDLWRHSVAAATAAEALGTYLPSTMGALSFTAALLHDIGKLVLARAAPRHDMESVWKMVSTEGCTCVDAEKATLGFSHAEVGAEILSAWKMPDDIVTAVKNHHAAGGSADPMTDGVMVANIVARSIGEGVGHEGMSVGIDPSVAHRMGLTKVIFEGVCVQTACRMKEVVAHFGVGGS